MGKTGIRSVNKVSFDKPASEQSNLHVSHHSILNMYCITVRSWALTSDRTDGIPTVSFELSQRMTAEESSLLTPRVSSSFCCLNQRWRNCEDRMS